MPSLSLSGVLCWWAHNPAMWRQQEESSQQARTPPPDTSFLVPISRTVRNNSCCPSLSVCCHCYSILTSGPIGYKPWIVLAIFHLWTALLLSFVSGYVVDSGGWNVSRCGTDNGLNTYVWLAGLLSIHMCGDWLTCLPLSREELCSL